MPNIDWSPIIVALIVGGFSTIPGILTYIQGIKTHDTFNSKMDAMLELTKRSSFAEGRKAEKDKNAL